jgi:hypothetical protein
MKTIKRKYSVFGHGNAAWCYLIKSSNAPGFAWLPASSLPNREVCTFSDEEADLLCAIMSKTDPQHSYSTAAAEELQMNKYLKIRRVE